MSSTEIPLAPSERVGTCANVSACPQAVAGAALAWYPGPGEYCPDCGEALVVAPEATAPGVAVEAVAGRDDVATPPVAAAAPEPEPQAAPAAPPRAEAPRPERPRSGSEVAPPPRRVLPVVGRRWMWLFAALGLAIALVAYAQQRSASQGQAAPATLAVCTGSSSQQLAQDLVHGYAAQSLRHAGRYIVTPDGPCDVRFTTAADTPDAVIAHDGIVAIVNPLNPIARLSEKDVRAIFSGAVHDWSQVGGSPGPIVPVLPEATADETAALNATLLFNVPLERGIRRLKSSAEVTRAVTGADAASRRTIGLVAFSAAVPAKVVPLAYLPPPSVLSIATKRYPFTINVAIESAQSRADGAAAELVEFARSADGAAIIAKNGLVGTEGP